MGGKKLSRTEMINTKFCYQNAVSRGVCVWWGVVGQDQDQALSLLGSEPGLEGVFLVNSS